MAQRFQFLLDSFVDKRVLLNNKEFVAFEVTNTHVYVAPVDAELPLSRRKCRRVRLLEAVCGHVRVFMPDEAGGAKTSLPNDVKQIVKKTLDLKRDYEHRLRAATIIRKQLAQKLQELQATLDKYHEQEAARGPQLQMCQNSVGEVSLVNRIDSTQTKITENEVVLGALCAEASTVFPTRQAIVDFFADSCDMEIPMHTLKRWSAKNAGPLGFRGAPAALSEEAEDALIQTLLFMDSCGFPLGRTAVRQVAQQIVDDEKIKARFSAKGPTNSWYKRFFKRRMRNYPDLVMASKRTTDCNTTKWFNTELVTWWFAKFEKILLDEGFAKRKEDGTLEWVDLSRVILTDETCVSGGGTRKGTSGKSKVLTVKWKCTQSGKGYYRRVPEGRDYDDHITLVAGCLGNGDIAPPAWIFTCGTSGLQQDTKDKIQKPAPTFPELPLINGRRMEKAIVRTGPNGGIASDNIKEVMEQVFRAACPDFANEPGKKILWLTDAGPGRFDADFVKWMRQNEIVMVHWLPNTTSKMQMADTTLFGPFKALRDVLEAAHKLARKGEKVDRITKVKIAGEALIQSFTSRKIMAGLRETGMVPLDPTPLLNHPCIQDGDTMRQLVVSRAAQCTGRYFQSPSVTPRTAVSSSAGPDNAPSTPTSPTTPVLVPLADTPQHSAHSESLFTSISQQKPRLGRYRTLTEEADTTDKFSDIQQECLRKVDAQILTVQINLPQHMECDKRDVRHTAEKARLQAKEARRQLEEARSPHATQAGIVKLAFRA